MKTNEVKSFAKINLALHVTGKLTNLHKIESIVKFIELHDTISIKKIKSNKHKIFFNGNFSKNIKKAVELMPDDPTVNDHYGDILWKLNRNIQARYFWNYVLKLEDVDEDIKKKINIKITEGINNS